MNGGSVTRRALLRSFALALGSVSMGAIVTACQSSPGERTVEVTKIVQQQVPVTQVVEKTIVVTATPAPAQSGPVTIEFMYSGAADTTSPDGKWISQRVAGFEKANPSITVKRTDLPWNTQSEVLITRLVAGQPPDLAILHSSFSAEIGAGMHGLAVMDDLDEWKTYSQIFVPARLQTVEVSGKHYGVPWYGLVFGFAYQKATLEEAKQSPPKTWTDLVAVAKATTVPGKRYGWGAAMGQAIDSAYRVYPFVLVNGGRFMNEDLSKFTFNDPASVEALQLFIDMKKNGSTVPGMDTWDGGKEGDAFRSGIAVMGLAANWPGRLQKPELLAQWQLLPLPQPEKPTGSASSATLSDDVMLTITAQSKNKAPAFQLIQFLMNEQTSIERAITPGLLFPPVVQSAFKDPRWQQVWGHDAMEYELEHSVPWPYSTVIGEAQSIYALAVSKAFVGQMSAQQALDEGVAKAQQLFKK